MFLRNRSDPLSYSTPRGVDRGGRAVTFLQYARSLMVMTVGVLMMSGCGFHLRGQVALAPWFNNVAIIIQQAHRDIEPLLKEQLRAYNIRIAPSPAEASYWLLIENEDTQQQISGISSSTTPRQYQLIYTLRFQLQNRLGKPLMPPSKVIITRQVTINSDRILGSNDEEAQTKREMRQEAVTQILNRISRNASSIIKPPIL